MAEASTNFPPQTYSSSFFLNAIPEDENGASAKVKNKSESGSPSSPPLLDCFMKTMTQWKLWLTILALHQTVLKSSALQCSQLASPKVRTFANITEYQSNKIKFDPTSGGQFDGNYVRILKSKPNLEKYNFISFESNFVMRLMLSDLQIETIEDDTFLQMYCLESLELQHNSIYTVAPGSFHGLQHLRYLNLSYNALETLPGNVFNGLTHLKTLDLSYNKLKYFDDPLLDLVSLTHLNFSNNHLPLVPVDDWNSLSRLVELDLSNNDLVKFDFTPNITFDDMTRLLIDGNHLKDLNMHSIRAHAPNLVLLELQQNSWSCEDLSYTLLALRTARITFTAVNRTEDNVDGIDCIHQAGPSTSSVYQPCDTKTKLVKVNYDEVLQAISDVKSAVAYLAVFVVVFVIFEISVRGGLVHRIAEMFRRRNGLYMDNSNVEDIRLIGGSRL